MELTARTKTGLEFTLKSQNSNGIWHTMIHFSHPKITETYAGITRKIITEGPNSGIRVVVPSVKTFVLFALDASTVVTVRNYFADVDSAEAALKSAMDAANLALAQAGCPEGYVLARLIDSLSDSILSRYGTLDGVKVFASDMLEAHHGFYFISDELVSEEKKRIAAFDAKRTEAEKKSEALETAAFAEARKTGLPVILKRFSVECNDPSEECDCDNIVVYALPDGTKKTERFHTW